MKVRIYQDKQAMANAAAEQAAEAIRSAIREHDHARVVAATGASQFEFLEALTKMPTMEWSRVELFHLDEYIGLPANHKASFRKYLRDRLISKTGIVQCHLLNTEGDLQESVGHTAAALQAAPADVCFAGIGENGHLAFNDPPADFATEQPYIVVNLDEPCRRQQVGEGWFADLSEVPTQAISMSVRQILKAREIIAVVPDARKAQAVKALCEGEVSPLVPASILRTHANATIFLDAASAAFLSRGVEEFAEIREF